MKRSQDGHPLWSVDQLSAKIVRGGDSFSISCAQKLSFVDTLGADAVVAACVKTIRDNNISVAPDLDGVAANTLAETIARTRTACDRIARKAGSEQTAWSYCMDGEPVVTKGQLARAMPTDMMLSTLLSGLVRYSQRIQANHPCPLELWNRDDVLNKAVRYVCTSASKKDLDALSANRLRVFCMQGHGCKYATAFPIPVAMFMMQREAARLADGETLRVLDPCAGWGDRLAAAILCDVEYTGMDPWRVSVDLCARVHSALNGTARQRVIVSQGAETDWPLPVGETAHMVFTSPPYGALEQYGVAGPPHEHEQQAWHFARDEFVVRFIAPLLQHAYNLLFRGGCAVINVNDSSVQWVISGMLESARHCGFVLEETLGMSVSVRSTHVHGRLAIRGEPLFVFRKQ